MGMKEDMYALEVVTDNAIDCAWLAGAPVNEIVVPSSYVSKTAAGSRRALSTTQFSTVELERTIGSSTWTRRQNSVSA